MAGVALSDGAVAQWLEERDPSQLLDDVRSFARRRPGAFILIAAATGLVGGRLLRALTAEAKDEKEAQSARTDGPEFAAPAPSAYGTVGSSSFERDYEPTEPIPDPLGTSLGDTSLPNGSRP
ncbi:hypothetical protein [Rathayibacter tanaceti]|uniref:Uncharacterized protein n=2 Tax=Rathayibacter tanaceti TaxID=1671680 RepID=A0ACD2XMH0_9MICO|nr:hypothetical protein [Rathayibacter tanaceti]KZX21445.1 hypothetical protein ACH61_01406 [Rathayibacter tanaceti]TCO38031.1 hypothetical protein EV639_103218 [Rathayibacter tanaceti]